MAAGMDSFIIIEWHALYSRYSMFSHVTSQVPIVVSWISIKSALHYACEEGKTNAVAALLESGPDIDLQDNEGHTPLHKAAVRGHLAVVKLLRSVFKWKQTNEQIVYYMF